MGAAFDGRGASPNDWLLLSRVAENMCSNKNKTKIKHGKSLTFGDTENATNEKSVWIIN